MKKHLRLPPILFLLFLLLILGFVDRFILYAQEDPPDLTQPASKELIPTEVTTPPPEPTSEAPVPPQVTETIIPEITPETEETALPEFTPEVTLEPSSPPESTEIVETTPIIEPPLPPEETAEPSAVPVETLPSGVLFATDFQGGYASDWTASSGWMFSSNEQNVFLSAATPAEVFTIPEVGVKHLLFSAQIRIEPGNTAQIQLQQDASAYQIIINSNGETWLYRDGTLLASGVEATADMASWHTLRLRVFEGVVTVGIEDTLQIDYSDATWATVAAISIVTGTDNTGTVAVDDIYLEDLTPFAADEPQPTETPAPTIVRIINFDPAASEEAIRAMLEALGATEVSRIPQIGAMKVQVPQTNSSSAQAMAAIQSDPMAATAGVSGIEENFAYHIAFTPNDPAFDPSQWALKGGAGGTWVHNPSGPFGAWDIANQDGAGVYVAVLDTGVDLQHPDLAGQIDTSKGWDFINDDNNPDDDDLGGGHGTSVAGIIAAKTNNNQYMAGIAFNTKIISIKVCDAFGSCPIYEIAAGIVHAVDKGTHIINLSLGSPQISTTVQGAVQYAISKNVIVVAAAGNSNNTSYMYPASFPGVISVTAHDINAASFASANDNDRVTISAPGVNVYSLARMTVGGNGFWTGTSPAAAHISGIAALLYADNIARDPAKIREALICSAVDTGATGYDNITGYGIVQADWAMNWRINSASCKVTQPNDLIQNATEIKRIPFNVVQAVHSRSVTGEAGEPSTCFATNETLWYKFIPPKDDYYQISTHGSSYYTIVGVFQGEPGAWTQRACYSPLINFGVQFGLELMKSQIYYVGVGTNGTTINDQILQFDIRPGILLTNKDYQEDAVNIAYTGGWQQISVRGASGGKVMQTYNDAAFASFTFRGVGVDVATLTGPDQGSIEVWVDGISLGTINNRAATQVIQTWSIYPGSNIGQWHTVTLRRQTGGPAGPITIDRIRLHDYFDLANVPLKTITRKTDDRGQLAYLGSGWAAVNWPGSFQNTALVTSTSGDFVLAKVKGSTVVLYRHTNPSYGTMNIYVDGAYWGVVNNNGSNALSVPFAITNLAPVEHVIQFVNNSSSTLAIDAIEGLTTRALRPNKQYDIGDRSILRSALWTTLNTLGALAGKTYLTTDSSARLDFSFEGDAFCLAFMRRADGGTIQLYVDNMSTPYEYISTNSSSSFWGPDYFWPPDPQPGNVKRYCTGAAFGNGTHHVRLLMTSGWPVELDYMYPSRYGLITAQDGVVQENDRRIVHTPWVYSDPVVANTSSLWNRIQTQSPGGARPQGGYVKRASYFLPPPSVPPVVRFYMSGSGFIIYSSVGPSTGDLRVFVCEPADPVCSPVNIILGGVLQGQTIDLYNNRARPFAYAVTGLGPGIHEIQIYASLTAPGQYVDFDGVRIFP